MVKFLERLHPAQTYRFSSNSSLYDALSIAASQVGATSCSMQQTVKTGICLLAMPHNSDQRIPHDGFA